MSGFPKTQAELLLRIRDPEDRAAWTEFVEIYEPVLHRMARRRGLPHEDARDLAQKVLLSVSRSIEKWEQNPQRGRFRTWLTVVTRNATIDALRRLRPDTAQGGTSILQALNRFPQSEESARAEVEREYRRQVFRSVAAEIRDEFNGPVWDAFWRTTVENQPVTQVAHALGKTIGSVYAARSRVMRRLRERVTALDNQSGGTHDAL